MGAVAELDRMRIGEKVSESRESFRVKRTTVETLDIRKGWGVWVGLVYSGDDEPNPDEPVAADIGVVEIAPERCTFVGETFCIRISDEVAAFYVPVENFGDDDLDLSSDRFFETEQEARAHVDYITRALTRNGLVVSA